VMSYINMSQLPESPPPCPLGMTHGSHKFRLSHSSCVFFCHSDLDEGSSVSIVLDDRRIRFRYSGGRREFQNGATAQPGKCGI
jgi:hypothetical protein